MRFLQIKMQFFLYLYEFLTHIQFQFVIKNRGKAVQNTGFEHFRYTDKKGI